MTTIQVRIDNKTKQSAQKVLNELGLDMSSAIKVYLKQITIHHGIPLQLVTSNGLSPADEQSIIKASAEAKCGVNVTSAMPVREAIDYLMGL